MLNYDYFCGMIRKGIAYLILTSLLVHAGSRLGILENLYQKRHKIAFSIGLTNQYPITMCSSDYHFGKKLSLQFSKDPHAPSLPTFSKAQEIQLFHSSFGLAFSFFCSLNDRKTSIESTFNRYVQPIFSIFHPPSVC